MKEVVLWTGTGQIGMAIARRIGYGKKIIVGDKNLDNAKAIIKIMTEAEFNVVPVETDISSRESILNLIGEGQRFGELTALINAAGVSPSQASI
ncbi:SDR family NAD(P)-dependent oxidoreductase [Bacillales bacterium AN1005]